MSQLQTLIWAFVTRARAFESEILVALVVLVLAYFALEAWKEWRSNLPPGPYGLPIVGYLPFLSSNASHYDIWKLGEKYGDVFRLKLGSETIIVIHGVELIKEALSRPDFLGRPTTGALKLFNDGSAFFDADIHKWREQRRFVLQSMRDLGLGKSVLEGDISEEIRHFLDQLRTHNGAPMDVKEPLSPSMSNNISSLIFGKRYEYEDPDRVFLDKNLDIVVNFISSTTAVGFFPWIMKVPLLPKLLKIETADNSIKSIMAFIKKEINEHRDTFDLKNIRDFIDRFIGEQNSRKLKDQETTFTDDTLACNVMDLFTAGSETVRTSILWCLYTAAAFPEHQEKVREEILEVMGPERVPEYQDMKRMPFTHSFILEVMRWKTIVPLNVPHSTLSDTTIGGYSIPKNATIFTMLWNAHHDPNYWTYPEKFVPDRFITEDGKSVSKPAHYMPFSMGKRLCPGEPLAMMEIFLYFTSIIQKFQVAFPAGYKPNYEAVMGGTYRLEPYKIKFLTRN